MMSLSGFFAEFFLRENPVDVMSLKFESDLFGLVHLYFRLDYLPFKFDNSENPPPDDQVEDPIVEEVSEPEILPPPPTFDSFSHSNAYAKGFSFDIVPPSKWLYKLYEIHAWCTVAMLAPNATLSAVITKCTENFLADFVNGILPLVSTDSYS